MRNSLKTLPGLVLAASLLFTACGSDATADIEAGQSTDTTEPSDPADTESTEPTDTTADPEEVGSSEPPALQLTRGDNTIALNAWTYCWTGAGREDGICADGAPPETPELLAGEGPITLVFPHDFTFAATVYDAGYTTEVEKASVVATDEGWQIEPTVEGPAVLELFGNGPEGDVIISVAIG